MDGIVGRHLATVLDSYTPRQGPGQGQSQLMIQGQGQGQLMTSAQGPGQGQGPTQGQGLGQGSTQGQGPGLGQGSTQEQGPGLGQGPAQTQGLASSVNICAVNTTIHTFYARGMWQSPIFSGQLTVLCNNPQTR